MGQYTFSYKGKTYSLEAKRPPTQAEAEIYIAEKNLAELTKPSEDSSLWKTAVSPLKAGLELLGRPGEFVSGTIGGMAQTGSLVEGLKRGGRALFEPELVDSKIDEHTSKVLEEQGLLKDHPWLRAGVGFAGDVLADPLNLLGGAGVVRGLAKKALVAVGTTATAADKALLIQNPLRTAWQTSVVPTGAQAIQSLQGLPIVRGMFPDLPLKTITGASGETAEELGYLAKKGRQHANTKSDEIAGNWATTFGLTPEERYLIPESIREPGGDAWTLAQTTIAAEAAQGGSRLKDAITDYKRLTHDVWQTNVAEGHMRATGLPKQLAKELISEARSLHPEEKQLLKHVFQSPTVMNEFGQITATGLAEIHQALLSVKSSSKLHHVAQRLVADLQPTTRNMAGTPQTLPVVKFETLDFSAKGTPIFSTERPNFISQAAVTDLSVPEVRGLKAPFHELSPALASRNPQNLSWAEYRKRGGVTDAVDILKKHYHMSHRATANKNQMLAYARNFASKTPADGYREVAPDILAILPETVRTQFQQVHFPNAIVDQIEHVKERLDDPIRVEGALRRGLKLWKAYRTSANLPAHQAGNFVGNFGSIYAATDYSPDEIAKAVATATQVMRGTGEFSSFAVPGGTLTHKDFIKILDSYGLGTKAAPIIGKPSKGPARLGGLQAEMIQDRKLTPWAKTIFGQTDTPLAVLNPENAMFAKLQELNQHLIEDPAKMALMYLDMKSGKSADRAMLNVRKILIDYDDLTDFEKNYMRDFVPFYTWTRKTIPLQLAALAQRPAKASHQRRLFDLAFELNAGSEDPIDRKDLPPYLQRPNVFPIPGLKGGEDERPIYAKLPLPLYELEKLTADPERFLGESSFMLNPLLRMGIEHAIDRPVGAPSYVSLGDPDVPAGLLGRVAGTAGLGSVVGAWQDPETEQWRQSARGRWISNEVPIPFSAGVRTADPGGATSTGLNPFIELLLRGAGLSPTGVSEEVLARGRREKTRKDNQE